MASAITFTGLNYTGTPNSDDAVAARYIVDREKKGISDFVPASTPLPTDTNANLKASYLIVLNAIVTDFHNKAISDAKTSS